MNLEKEKQQEAGKQLHLASGVVLQSARPPGALLTDNKCITTLTSVCGHNPWVRMDTHIVPSNFSSHRT